MKQKINNLNSMQLNSMSSMLGTINSMQKIGKGKRKYSITLDKNSKKMLSRLVEEFKKYTASTYQLPNLIQFLDYVKIEVNKKSATILKLSYEEHEFLIRLITISIKEMSKIRYKWYNIFNKLALKLILKQYNMLLQLLKNNLS